MSTTPTTPVPGPLAPLRAADTLLPCPVCHGYGTADGEPAGDLARDTYDDPGPCAACGGAGEILNLMPMLFELVGIPGRMALPPGEEGDAMRNIITERRKAAGGTP